MAIRRISVTFPANTRIELDVDIPDVPGGPPPPPPPPPGPPVNKAPVVNAGQNQSVQTGTTVTLNGTVRDDGLPAGAPVTAAWSMVSGPGSVTFGNVTQSATNATFSEPGSYVLRLTTSDGLLTSSDDMTVTVSAVAPPYEPPTGGGTGFEIRNQAELDSAIVKSNPGDTLTMRGGDYAGGISEMRGDPGNRFGKTMGGAPNAWWTLQAAPGEVATFQDDLKAYSIQWCRFLGIHFGDGAKIGIGSADWISGWKRSNHIEIKRVRLAGRQTRFGMIQVMADDMLIEDYVIEVSGTEGLTTDHGVYLMNGRRNTLRRGRISGAAGYGIHVYDEKKHPSDPQNFYEDILVEEHVISGCRLRAGIIVSTGGDTKVLSVLIRKNVTYENNSGGICLTNYGRETMEGIKVLNNTCIDKIFWSKPGISNSEVRRNIALAGIHPTGGDVVIEDNFTSGDAGFVDAANHDFRLLPNSPAIGYGAL